MTNIYGHPLHLAPFGMAESGYGKGRRQQLVLAFNLEPFSGPLSVVVVMFVFWQKDWQNYGAEGYGLKSPLNGFNGATTFLISTCCCSRWSEQTNERRHTLKVLRCLCFRWRGSSISIILPFPVVLAVVVQVGCSGNAAATKASLDG